jgi:glycosyltransferase involved in cell wall biosynthesis
MRVSVVSTYPPVRDGIGQYVYFLYPNLAKLGVHVNVIADKRYPSDGGLVVLDIWHQTINLLATFRILRASIRTSSDILHYQFHPALYGRIMNLVLVPLSMVLLRFCSKKIVMTFHTIRILSKSSGRERAAVSFYTRLLALLSHKVIALTQEMRDLLVNEYNVRSDKIAVIPFGIRNVQIDDHLSAKQEVGLGNRFSNRHRSRLSSKSDASGYEKYRGRDFRDSYPSTCVSIERGQVPWGIGETDH